MSFHLVAFCFITVCLPFPNDSSLKCVIDVACFSFNIGVNLGSFPSNWCVVMTTSWLESYALIHNYDFFLVS